MNLDRPLGDLVRESAAARVAERKARRGRKGAAGAAAMDVDGGAAGRKRGGIAKKRRARRAKEEGAMDVEVVGRKRGGRAAPGAQQGGQEEAQDAPSAPSAQGGAQGGASAQGRGRGVITAALADRMAPRGSTFVAKKLNKGVKVSVSNLDTGVTQTDIAELFETVGPLKSASLMPVEPGRVTSVAEVVFEKMADALRAIKRYNLVPLDGRPLKISLSTDSAPIRISKGRRGRKTMTVLNGAMDVSRDNSPQDDSPRDDAPQRGALADGGRGRGRGRRRGRRTNNAMGDQDNGMYLD